MQTQPVQPRWDQGNDGGDGTSTVRHELGGRAYGPMIALWPLVVRWAHDAVIEDAFDRAERSLGLGPAVPATWSPWIRLLRAVHGRVERRQRVREIGTSAELLAAATLPRVDVADTFVLRLPPGTSRDVVGWHRAFVEDSTPGWLDARVRHRRALQRARGSWLLRPRPPLPPPDRPGDAPSGRAVAARGGCRRRGQTPRSCHDALRDTGAQGHVARA